MSLFENITARAIQGQGCTADEALFLVRNIALDDLIASADKIRAVFFGKRISMCMIINAKSGICTMDCQFCAQSGHHSLDIAVFPFLRPQRLNAEMARVISSGSHACGVVTSGGKLHSEDLGAFIEVMTQQPATCRTCEICASFGRLSEDGLQQLKDAGLDRYHHNLETSEQYYPRISSTQQWRHRLETVKSATRVGLKVCSGGLFGLGESWEDRIQLALTLRECEVDRIPINFLNPRTGTPLGHRPLLAADEALRIIALYRHLLPSQTLKVCGGRAVTLGDKQPLLFVAGANSLMTGDYLTTKGRMPQEDVNLIRACGFTISRG